MAFVLDCSAAMAWCFEEEHREESAAILARLEKEEAHVPAIWPLEIANVLLVAERRLGAMEPARVGPAAARLPTTPTPSSSKPPC